MENRGILTPLFILGEGCSILIKVHFLYYSQGPLSIKTSSLVQCIVKCFQFFFFSDLNLLARHQRGTCKNVNLCVPLVSAQTESYEHLRKNFETGRATPSVLRRPRVDHMGMLKRKEKMFEMQKGSKED